jgi:hypothetical protein
MEVDVRDARTLAGLAIAQQNQIVAEIAAAPETANKVLMTVLHSQSTILMMLASMLLDRAAKEDETRIVPPGGFRA